MKTSVKKRHSKEFLDLVQSIGECRSKTEEDAIIVREVETLKARLSDTKLDRSKMKEYLLRLVYVEMLGHDASFGYIHAVKMCNESALMMKKVGYMTTTLFLDDTHELILLIVNTLQQDLKNDNHLIVCSALNAVCKLVNAETIPALLQSVVDLLTHQKELVRKKAVIALHCFNQRSPATVAHLQSRFRQMLCDKDPSVMSATLCALYEIIQLDPSPYRNLVPSFVNILKQVVEHRLPKTYDYHRIPAPFVQIKLLKILALLGASNKQSSEHMYSTLTEVLRRGDSNNTIGNAILYECGKTISMIYPNPRLLDTSAEIVARFLRSSSHNLKYIGIDALGAIVRINAKYAVMHQMAVIDCLNDSDDTLKRKTMTLLYKMTKPANITVIVEKMIGYLKTLTEPHIKEDVVSKVIELAERYAPTNQWFIDTVNEVLYLAGDQASDAVGHNLMRLIAEGAGDDDESADNELRTSAVNAYLELLSKPNLPEILLKIVCWVLGEYGLLSSTHSAEDLQKALVDIAERQAVSDHLKAFALSALTKVCAHSKQPLTARASELVRQAGTSRSLQLQQLAHELQALLSSTSDMLAAVLPPDSSCEDIEVDAALPFLDDFVAQAVAGGAAPYVAPEDRQSMKHSSSGEPLDARAANSQGLLFAYETPAAPAVAAAAPAPTPSTGGESSSAGAQHLSFNTSAAPRKWGPPQPYESAPPRSSDVPAASSSSAPEPPAPAAAPEELSEKELLAMSLFGGLTGSSAPPAAAPRSARTASKPSGGAGTSAPAPAPASAPAPAPAPTPAMDLLLDLDVPAPTPGAAPNGATEKPPADVFSQLADLTVSDVPPAVTSGLQSSAPAPPAASQTVNLSALYSSPSMPAAGPGMGMAPMAPGMMPGMMPGGMVPPQMAGMMGMMGMPAGMPPQMGGPMPPQMGAMGMMPGMGMKGMGAPGAAPAASSPMVAQSTPQAPPKEDPFKDLLG